MDTMLFFEKSHYHAATVSSDLPPSGTIYERIEGRDLGSLDYQIEGDAICVTRTSILKSGFLEYSPANVIAIPDSINDLPVRAFRGKVYPGEVYLEGGVLTELELFVCALPDLSCAYSEDKTVYEYPNACGCRVTGVTQHLVDVTIHCPRHLLFQAPGQYIRIDAPHATPYTPSLLFERSRSSGAPIVYRFSGDVVPDVEYYPFDGCTEEHMGHFRGNSALKYVSGTLRGKESWSFTGCRNLKEVHFGNGMKKLSAECFKDCSSLEDFYVPDSVREVGNSAFDGCTALQSVHLPSVLEIIPDQLFCGCSSLRKCFIPGSIRKIGAKAFFGCTSLRRIWLPDGLVEIGEAAFRGCVELREFTLPASVTSIGEDAFSDIPDLILRCFSGSVAEAYAIEHSLRFVTI